MDHKITGIHVAWFGIRCWVHEESLIRNKIDKSNVFVSVFSMLDWGDRV